MKAVNGDVQCSRIGFTRLYDNRSIAWRGFSCDGLDELETLLNETFRQTLMMCVDRIQEC